MQVHQGKPWVMHDIEGVMLSHLNGSLENFKSTRKILMKRCFERFDKVTDTRGCAITDEIQSLLHDTCHNHDEVQALMIYLVEECGLLTAQVRREIKAPHLRLGFDLRRRESLVSA